MSSYFDARAFVCCLLCTEASNGQNKNGGVEKKRTGAMATQVEPKGSRGGAEAHGIGGIESGEGLREERDNYLMGMGG